MKYYESLLGKKCLFRLDGRDVVNDSDLDPNDEGVVEGLIYECYSKARMSKDGSYFHVRVLLTIVVEASDEYGITWPVEYGRHPEEIRVIE